MTSRRTAVVLLILSAGLLTTGCAMPDPLRVMSFNIRYAGGDDGANAWEHRRPLVIETIRNQGPDVIGLQEVLHSQAEELTSALPDYTFVGVGREDGKTRGEYVPIMFRKARFTLLDHGCFWLSEQPDRPGSVGWDAALPRIVTWVRLRFNEAPFREVQIVNVHFDHRGEQARCESARLLHKLVESLGGRPLVMLGDFNCRPGSEPHTILTQGRNGLWNLQDVQSGSPKSPFAQAGTYHGFTGNAGSQRIDWILISERFDVVATEIDRHHAGDLWPSDHFPVIATIRLNRGCGTGYT